MKIVFDNAERASILFGLLMMPWFAASEDWPKFLGPHGDGTSLETGLLDAWPDAGPALVWDKPIGTGYSAPSVLDGNLALFHRQGNEEIIQCFSAATGEPVWRHAYPTAYSDPYGYNNGPRGAPLLTDEFVYAFGAQGILTCLNLRDGSLVWRRDTQKDWDVPEAFFGVGSAPLLEGGLLIVMVGGQPNSGVVAFNAKTGETVWENVGRDAWQGQPMAGWRGNRTVEWENDWKLASYSTPVAATIHGKRHALCLMRQGLVSLDPKDGSVNFTRWFRAPVNESVNAMTPAVDGEGRVFISNSYYRTGGLQVRVQEDGKGFDERWLNQTMENHFDTPKLIDGYLYGFSGRHEYAATLRCVDWNTGELMWQTDGKSMGDEAGARAFSRGDLERRYGRGSAVVADGKWYILSEWGRLIIAKAGPSGFEEISRHAIPDFKPPTWTAPVLANGLLYLRNGERLICFKISK